MRVLICWNTSAAFNPIADWLIDNGHEVRMVMRGALDLGGCTRNHAAGVIVDGVKMLDNAVWASNGIRADTSIGQRDGFAQNLLGPVDLALADAHFP